MRIDSIHLTSYRCFRDRILECPPGFSALVGMNRQWQDLDPRSDLRQPDTRIHRHCLDCASAPVARCGRCEAPQTIILLRAQGTEHPAASYGLDANRTPGEIMGAAARPVEIAHLLQGIFDALGRHDLERGGKDSHTLSKLSPDLPALERIAALAARKALLQR